MAIAGPRATLAQLAARTHVHADTVAHLFAGGVVLHTTLLAVADALRIHPRVLIETINKYRRTRRAYGANYDARDERV